MGSTSCEIRGLAGEFTLAAAIPLAMVSGVTMFRIGEAAELLGVSADTVRRWVDAGRLAAARDEHGHRVIDGVDLAAFARTQADRAGRAIRTRPRPATGCAASSPRSSRTR